MRRSSFSAWALVLGCVGLAALGAAEPPPSVEAEVSAFSTPIAVNDPANRVPGGKSESLTLSVLSRQPLAPSGWYWTCGLQREDFFFATGPISRLQDYAGVFGIEYYQDGDIAAGLSVRPGLYFGRRAQAGAWDIPVDLASGVPISAWLAGVVGFSSARFYHHALPIFGLQWTGIPHVRVQLVFPEPAVEFRPDSRQVWRIGGELVGGGFLVEQNARQTPVEYSSYRVGLQLTQKFTRSCRITFDAGMEAERTFDAFRADGRRQGGGRGYVSLSMTLSH